MSGFPSPREPEGWLAWRDQSRRNLLFLCNAVLGYKDVCLEVHGPILDNLQHFDGGRDPVSPTVRSDGTGIGTLEELASYQPWTPIEQLPGCRKTLNLVFRGSLKTSICTIGHSIQWIINYPDIRILFSAATGTQVEKFLTETKRQFQHNEMFRYLFPEFCPQGNVIEFGNRQEFTVPARRLHRKEPTVSTVSVGSVMAGGHFDVLKSDDVVDAENVRTVEQMQVVENHLQMMEPLVERYNTENEDLPNTGWTDFMGTRYHFSDAYGKIIESEDARKKKMGDAYTPVYKIVIMPILKEGISIYDPNAVPRWRGRYPVKECIRMYEDPMMGGPTFNSQMMLNPIPDGEGLVDSEKQIVWMPANIIKALYSRMSLHVTVDLAGMEQSKGTQNDYTAITLGGFTGGRLYVLEIIHGRPSPFDVINHLYAMYKRHPRIIAIKVEKENHARVLLPFLRNEQYTRGWLPIVELKRDNQISKINKIKGLIPWFKSGRVRFSDEIVCKDVLINEILRFPKWHLDCLDTIRDLMEADDGGVISDVINMPPPPPDNAAVEGRFIGFGGLNHQPMFEGQMTPDTAFQNCDPVTGL